MEDKEFYFDFVQLDNFYKPIDFAQRGLTDCYFYYYSSCKNGDLCPYRHEPAALGHEVMCSRWLEGHCNNAHCKERHMIISKRRDQTPCFWEKTSSGCRKPHCVFRHTRATMSPVPEEESGRVEYASEVADKVDSIPTADEGIDLDNTDHDTESTRTKKPPLEKLPTIVITDESADAVEEHDDDSLLKNSNCCSQDISQSSSGIESLVSQPSTSSELQSTLENSTINDSSIDATDKSLSFC